MHADNALLWSRLHAKQPFIRYTWIQFASIGREELERGRGRVLAGWSPLSHSKIIHGCRPRSSLVTTRIALARAADETNPGK